MKDGRRRSDVSRRIDEGMRRRSDYGGELIEGGPAVRPRGKCLFVFRHFHPVFEGLAKELMRQVATADLTVFMVREIDESLYYTLLP